MDVVDADKRFLYNDKLLSQTENDDVEAKIDVVDDNKWLLFIDNWYLQAKSWFAKANNWSVNIDNSLL